MSLPLCIPTMTPVHPCALLVETNLTMTSLRGVVESTFKNQHVPFTQKLWNTITTTHHEEVLSSMQSNCSSGLFEAVCVSIIGRTYL